MNRSGFARRALLSKDEESTLLQLLAPSTEYTPRPFPVRRSVLLLWVYRHRGLPMLACLSGRICRILASVKLSKE